MKRFFTLLSISIFSFFANTQVLGVYEFTGTGACPNQNPIVTSQPTNGTYSDFTKNGVNCVVTGNVFNADNWSLTFNDTSYYEFTLSASSGNVLNLDSLIFLSRISNSTASWSVRSSLDSYATDIFYGDDDNQLDTNRNLFPSNFSNISSVSFRIYAFNIDLPGRTWRVDDVTLKGTIESSVLVDNDGDGYSGPDDCDDTNASIYLGATEIANNGIDEDCDGADLVNLPVDSDGDGFSGPDDCDETNVNIHVGATEIPNNGIDEDCNGSDMLVSLSELNVISATIFPNPGTNNLTIQTASKMEDLNVKIFGTDGKRVFKKAFKNVSSVNIDTESLNAGMYIVEISTDSKSSKFTWVKN